MCFLSYNYYVNGQMGKWANGRIGVYVDIRKTTYKSVN